MIICAKCKHYCVVLTSTKPGYPVWEHQCKTRPGVMDHVTGDSSPALCYAFNKDGDCQLYEDQLEDK